MAEDEAIRESQVGASHGMETALEGSPWHRKLICPGRNRALMMTSVMWGWFNEICSLGRSVWLQCRRYAADGGGGSGLQRPARG